jgi:hypothetical protein
MLSKELVPNNLNICEFAKPPKPLIHSGGRRFPYYMWELWKHMDGTRNAAHRQISSESLNISATCGQNAKDTVRCSEIHRFSVVWNQWSAAGSHTHMQHCCSILHLMLGQYIYAREHEAALTQWLGSPEWPSPSIVPRVGNTCAFACISMCCNNGLMKGCPIHFECWWTPVHNQTHRRTAILYNTTHANA